MISHWYFITIWRCPLCLREFSCRERRYTPKPVWESRREVKEYSCTGCHFL